MSKNLLALALAANLVLACTHGGDDSSAPPTALGPAPPPPGTGTSPLPPFNFGDGGGSAPVDSGTPDGPVDNDPGAAFGARVWGTDLAGNLVSFRLSAPAKVSNKRVTGLPPGEKILNVSYRPVNAMMYGLSNRSRLYTIDPQLGVATVVGDGSAFTPRLMAQADGFGFNPVSDKIRVHTDVNQNLRLDPTSGAVAGVDAALTFGPDDVNVGQSPTLIATAHTNNVNPKPASTMLYAIDSTRDLLVRLPNPNDGKVETIGELGFDVDPAGGFDISRQGIPYASLHVGAETGLYTIDLGTGAATKMGAIGYPTALTSIAIER